MTQDNATDKPTEAPGRVAIIGGGVIGGGWAARALASGSEVIVFDTDTDTATRRIQQMIDIAWPSLTKRGLSAQADRDNWRVTDDLAEAVGQADLIQENVPERLELKQKVLADIDSLAPEQALIGSSTSGFLPTDLQAQCRHKPERVFVAHPFNPVYLLPLVELVGGDKTTQETLDKAQAIYRGIGMRPLVVRKEIEGHIADRLMEALWREALHLVNDGIATTEEIDAAVVYGAGLRWSLMGTFLTFHLAGGEQGMRHMLEQFGPALKLPWTKLEAPELTDELIDKVVAGTEHQSAGRPVAELESRRDEFLTDLLNLVEKYWPENEGLKGYI